MRRWLLILVPIALVMGAAGKTAYEWRDVEVFHEYGGWGAGAKDWGIDRPIYLGMTSERKGVTGDATLRSAKAIITRNTGDADVTTLLCTVNADVIGSIGSVDQDGIEEECTELEPVDSQTIPLNAWPQRQQVVLRIELHQPGRVVVKGIDLAYSYGWRTGSQRVGGKIKIGAR